MMLIRNSIRSGFTLIELLIVIGCMMILIGMVSSGVMMLMKYQLKTDTVRLVDQLTAAITIYMDEEKVGVPNIESNMLYFLYKYPEAYKKPPVPYLEPAAIFWSGGAINRDLSSADTLCDAWGNALQYEQWNIDATTGKLTTNISYSNWGYGSSAFKGAKFLERGNVIRSQGASATSNRDDLVWVYTTESGWRQIQ